MICKYCGLEKEQKDFEQRPYGYRKQCKVCVKIRRATYYIKNKESIKEKVRKRYDREKHTLYSREWVNKNREKRREINRASELRRRAAKIKSPFDNFSTLDVMQRWGDKCYYCGAKFEHIDHYIPLSKGGSHTLENVRPSCSFCNTSKNNKMPEEFISRRK
jgi:5-methylcytosine-specific restriction endonuclease McrA